MPWYPWCEGASAARGLPGSEPCGPLRPHGARHGAPGWCGGGAETGATGGLGAWGWKKPNEDMEKWGVRARDDFTIWLCQNSYWKLPLK